MYKVCRIPAAAAAAAAPARSSASSQQVSSKTKNNFFLSSGFTHTKLLSVSLEIWKFGNNFPALNIMPQYAYFCRITRSYSDLSGLVSVWSSRASEMVVYEHEGEKTEKIHIHLVIKTEVCKKMLKTLIEPLNLDLKGNKDWSFKNWSFPDTTPMVYMSKGKYMPLFMKGYTLEQAEQWKSDWKEPSAPVNRLANLYDSVFGDEEQVKTNMEVWVKRQQVLEDEYGLRFDQRLTVVEHQFQYIRLQARTKAFEESNMIWSMKTMNDYKSLVYTYIMRHNLPIPSKFKEWAKYM